MCLCLADFVDEPGGLRERIHVLGLRNDDAVHDDRADNNTKERDNIVAVEGGRAHRAINAVHILGTREGLCAGCEFK